ncbi:MAG: DsbA family protein [Pseudomonadales bacterium]|nr:DsbA family protein [Pseudomonadales bacterium]
MLGYWAIGLFGVPTFVVGDQLFWGNDRLELLRHHLNETKI